MIGRRKLLNPTAAVGCPGNMTESFSSASGSLDYFPAQGSLHRLVELYGDRIHGTFSRERQVMFTLLGSGFYSKSTQMQDKPDQTMQASITPRLLLNNTMTNCLETLNANDYLKKDALG